MATATALEQARAQVEGYDLPLTDSLKNNLIWALLPIALSGRTAVHANTAQKYIDTHSTSMNGVAMADSARNIQTTLQQAREAMRAGNLSEAQKIIQANETRITQAADVVRQSTQTSTQQVGQNINPSPEILAARKGVRSNLQTQIKETIRNTKELRDRISTLSQDGK